MTPRKTSASYRVQSKHAEFLATGQMVVPGQLVSADADADAALIDSGVLVPADETNPPAEKGKGGSGTVATVEDVKTPDSEEASA